MGLHTVFEFWVFHGGDISSRGLWGCDDL